MRYLIICLFLIYSLGVLAQSGKPTDCSYAPISSILSSSTSYSMNRDTCAIYPRIVARDTLTGLLIHQAKGVTVTDP